MKVKDLSQPLLSGRMGNLIYYVRNGVQCVRRAEVPGKKRKKERSDQQKGVTGRFAIVQAFYAAYCRQVSRDIWRAAARAEGKMAHNLFNSTNCRCFSGEGKLVDFVNFTFTKGSLLLPRGLKIEQVEGTERRFRVSWQEEREWATATGSDLLQIGVLYDSLPLGPRLAVSVSGRRQDLCGEFTLSERATDGAHVYCFFAREDGSAYSDCQYLHLDDIFCSAYDMPSSLPHRMHLWKSPVYCTDQSFSLSPDSFLFL